MRIIHDYTLDDKRSDGKILVLCSQEHLCDGCKKVMSCKDRRDRIGLTYGGEKRIYMVRRLYCSDCHRMHTELPDFLVKYKHYEVQIIEDAIDGQSFEDQSSPVPDTIRRWKVWFDYILPFLESAMESLYTELAEHPPFLFERISSVQKLRLNGEGWLITVLSILINTNKYVKAWPSTF